MRNPVFWSCFSDPGCIRFLSGLLLVTTVACGLEALSFRALGHLPGGNTKSLSRDISGDGTVAAGSGSSEFSVADARDSEAFRWTAADGLQRLQDLPGGHFYSAGIAISADGSVIVGASSSAASNAALSTGDAEAFRWTQAGGMLGLGDLTGGIFYSVANGVSTDGSVVVGSSSSAASEASSSSTVRRYEAFRWTAASGMVGLGTLRTGRRFSSQAYAVTPNEAFLWKNGSMTPLGDLEGGAFARHGELRPLRFNRDALMAGTPIWVKTPPDRVPPRRQAAQIDLNVVN